jgi:hypothetical protein
MDNACEATFGLSKRETRSRTPSLLLSCINRELRSHTLNRGSRRLLRGEHLHLTNVRHWRLLVSCQQDLGQEVLTVLFELETPLLLQLALNQ